VEETLGDSRPTGKLELAAAARLGGGSVWAGRPVRTAARGRGPLLRRRADPPSD
jgi:hypothetical protein